MTMTNEMVKVDIIEILELGARRMIKSDKQESKRRSLMNQWKAVFSATTNGDYNLECMFLLEYDRHGSIMKACLEVQKYVMANRELNTEEILNTINELEKNGDRINLIDFLQITSLRFFNDHILNDMYKRMGKTGTTWRTIVEGWLESERNIKERYLRRFAN